MTPCISAEFGRGATSHLPFLPRKLIATWRILLSFLKHPHTSWLFLRFGLASRPRRLWKIEQSFSGIAMLPRLEMERASLRSQSEILIFAQGVVQLLGSIALPSDGVAPGGADVLAPALLSGRISGLVWTDCPPSVALDRLRNRSYSKSRFSRWSDEAAEGYMTTMLEVLETAVRAAEEAGIPVLRLDALRPIEENRARTSAWIASLAGRTAAA